ncbi:MAG: 16S rRNA (guanine(527)-N(7))-methyltransferase RsmG [Anaerolineae bacterium]|uniref:16S rRNA (guanine(527)-N(7))-methyltransferase RsmG n=1 Tax=Promineifilum sp. TaxID=2664178 RepID=UPI001D4511C7|nr:16S rRNA (guanine(527)-N(7))-methyltransferase RsmG [Anaerolineales bacterium]MCB8934651.1 16S rRNA (guanine(527)-N(7))-methyltransferase RsmG [Promineifilum sp.]MCO5180991.1 16S rRNA (guanine(527)-N(7))-methyltransferase RsmG [Promineifilum sp.]MCW5846647.1 16S rRNA (guanine(527)-N(7))-methyltransferase RsmG [Anaerolineae bacterium]
MNDLAGWAQSFDLHLTTDQLRQFDVYERLLLEWNDRISLTAIRGPHEIRIRHFLDSLTCATVTGSLAECSMIDVGSGAGFPGLPLKILFPGLRLTMMDSIGKKARFLELVVRELGLRDVTVLAERAETLGHSPTYRATFDWATARAVAELRVLAELLLPFVRVEGHVLAQKGESARQEMTVAATAIATLGGGETTITGVRLPETEQTHYLIVIAKQQPTDDRYPRRVGMPAKRPL